MPSLRSIAPSLTRITIAGAVGAAMHIGQGDKNLVVSDSRGFSIASIAGDYLECRGDTEETTTSTSATKVKEAYIGREGTYRIKFDLQGTNGYGYGQIYKNGVAVGTLQSKSGSGFTEKIEDISGWEQGNLCQLYIYKSVPADSVEIKNFKICSGNPISAKMDWHDL